jgi:hypothetical protein
MAWAALLLLAAGGQANAQSEVTAYGGVTHFGSGGGTHALGGAAYGYNINERAQVFGELNYTPLGSSTIFSDYPGVTTSGSAKALNVGAGVLYNAGSNSSRAKPYLLATVGDGIIRASYTIRSAAGNVSVSGSSNQVYAGVGGGVRLLVGDRWGVRPEVRYQRYLQDGGGNSLMVNVGVFFQFGK